MQKDNLFQYLSSNTLDKYQNEKINEILNYLSLGYNVFLQSKRGEGKTTILNKIKSLKKQESQDWISSNSEKNKLSKDLDNSLKIINKYNFSFEEINLSKKVENKDTFNDFFSIQKNEESNINSRDIYIVESLELDLYNQGQQTKINKNYLTLLKSFSENEKLNPGFIISGDEKLWEITEKIFYQKIIKIEIDLNKIEDKIILEQIQDFIKKNEIIIDKKDILYLSEKIKKIKIKNVPVKIVNILNSMILKNQKKFDKNDINDFFKDNFNISSKKFTKEDIKNTYIKIKKDIIGQDAQIKKVVSSLFINKILNRKPNGVYMFLGPTGVGKTETCKRMAEELYDSKKKCLIINMNEYQHEVDIYKLTGSNPGFVGFGETQTLSDRLRKMKEGIILFDEVEKAHKSFYDYILKGIEEGKLGMGSGDEADLSNFTLIFTSNLIQDYQSLVKSQKKIGFNTELNQENESIDKEIKMKETIIEKLKGDFKQEFLGRFDDFFLYNPLSEEDLRKILEIKIQKNKEKIEKEYIKGNNIVSKQDIIKIITFSKNEKDKIIKETLKTGLGGRYIEKKLSNYIACKIQNILGLED